jgi:protein-L-isoaspartate(D-aspartate) O-methyltransferase
MAQVVDVPEGSSRAARLRDALVDRLKASGRITMPGVEAAFRAVPRHAFVPAGTALEVVYDVDRSVITKRDERGAVSSVSATYIQARMIEQAGIGAGMRVLEVGSGGYNAALLAEIVGPGGKVVSVDIDPDITDQASALLDATGYGTRVRVLCADAEPRLPGEGVFDRILVTVGAWDIPPAWLEHLADDGVLVVPLRMNGVTRTIAFRRDTGHNTGHDAGRLVSTSTEVAGFVPMRGDGAHPERTLALPDRQGRHVTLHFDGDVITDPALLDGVLSAGRTERWSGITIGRSVSFADLYLWFAGFLPGFCQLTVDDGVDLAFEDGRWFTVGAARGDSFAYLVVRPLSDDSETGSGVEFGACAYGPHGDAPAAAMIEQIQAWHRHARYGPAPTFAYWPTGTHPADQPPQPATATVILPKTHGVLTTSWPAAN